MNDKTEKKTLVEEGTEFIGTMRATCPIVVRGKIEGDVEAPAVSVTGTGSMSGNVKAKRVDSQGVLAGSVEADEVSLAGEVRSDTVIRARSLEVKLAAKAGRLEVTFGDCILDVGDAATEHAATGDTAKASSSAAPEPMVALAAADTSAASARDNSSRAAKKRAHVDATPDDAAAERAEPVATAEPDAAVTA